MRSHLVRLAIPLLALPLAGCPKAIRFGPEGEVTDPKVLMQLMDQRSARVLSVKAEAKVGVRTPQQSGTVSEFIAALRPSALHLETLNFFGKPVAVLVSDGERFYLFNEEEGAYYTGPATAANVSRLLPIQLEPEEAVMLLLGDVPRIPAERSRLEIDEEKRAYLLTLERGPLTQRIWVGTEDYRPLRSELRGAPSYDLTLSDYQAFGAVVFPLGIDIVFHDGQGRPTGTELSIRYKDVEVNPPTDLTLFTLEQPPNSRLVQVDELGRVREPSPPQPEPEPEPTP